MSGFLDGLRAAAEAALFPTDGTLRIEGLAAPVTIRRDAYGVPAIEAASMDDLWFAQGVVTAGERLFQLDLLLRAATGRLSEVFAERTLAEDRFARTIGFARAGARQAGEWDEESRRMHARFREGVAAWIGAMPVAPVEYSLLDISPQLPDAADAYGAAFCYLAWSLSGNWDNELLRAWIHERAGADAVAELLPPPPHEAPTVAAGALGGAVFDALSRPRGQGSNEWVVAGSRTASGSPLLANDPHLLATQPGAWLELHLSAPGYRARGVALTFSPGILLGTTAHHAWGVTNVSGDVQDLYVERLNAEGSAAEYEGAWEPLTIHREEISVRGEADPHVVEVRESRHGPLLDTFVSGVLHPDHIDLPSEPIYALRWTGHTHGIRPSLTVAAAKARSFEEFREAALGVDCPGQNFVYADVGGTIGYACTGAFPIRRTGDGTAPVPGHVGDHAWDGFIPPEELPWSKDPERGFLATANNRVTDESYPHLIGHDVHAPYRARRIVEVLAARSDHDVASMMRLQCDTVSLAARETLPLLLGRLGDGGGANANSGDAGDRSGDTEVRDAAVALLRGWNGDMAADSAAAAIFTVWCTWIARRVVTPLLGEELFARYHAWREPFQCLTLPQMLRAGAIDIDVLETALEDALDELHERIGTRDPATWRWGAIHRLRLAHPLASIPGLDDLFLAAEVEVGGDEQTVMQTGFDGRDGYPAAVIPSWRAVYDLADLDRSVGVVPTGVSGDPASPHWNDQTELWLGGLSHPLPFGDAAIEAATVATLRVEPGSISG